MPTKTHRRSRRSPAAKATALVVSRPARQSISPLHDQRDGARQRAEAKQAKPAAPLARIDLVVDQARAFAEASRSARTRHEYQGQWRTFEAWCAARAQRALPAEPATVALFITDRASNGIKPASLGVALSAISAVHRAAGTKNSDLPTKHPTVAEVLSGIRRTLGVRPRRVAPCVVPELRAMTETLAADTLIGQRDRALLVVGFAGAFRRSELVALDVADAAFTKAGLVITIRRSKVDQVGAGVSIGLPYGSDPSTCPVRTLKAWVDAAAVAEGALFRSVNRHGQLGSRLGGRDVARIVQRTAAASGLNAALYSGHSLRSGLATSAARAGKSDRAIMAQGRWTGRSMVDRYVRDAKLLDGQNAASGIGL
jgi:site-specific recombinase XerD